jgi:TPR repeat protein
MNSTPNQTHCRERDESHPSLAETIAKQLHESGQYHEYGLAPDASPAQAVLYYRKAAMRGYAPAQNSLGFCYLSGFGVPIDPHLAAKWFAMSARQGYTPAMANLGALKIEGRGIKKDTDDGLKHIYHAIIACAQSEKDPECLELDESFLNWVFEQAPLS